MDFELKPTAAWMPLALATLLASLTGCQSLREKTPSNPWSASKPPSEVALASDEQPIQESRSTGIQLVDYITGGTTRGPSAGRDLYQQGHAIYVEAAKKPKGTAKNDFYKAAKLFAKAAKSSKDYPALQQDALFMEGESMFFADRLTSATEAYQKLQKNHPRSKHNDNVAARLFEISRYWIDAARAGDDSWFKVNLTDNTRPTYDAKGHAIRVLDQIRYDDPTGRLADDATMAAAAEYLRLEQYDKADEFLTDLRETFTDSDHMFMAHILGIRAKLEVYAGPTYSGLALQEAEKLVKQTRQRFPDRLRDKEISDLLARASAEISLLRAERLEYRAKYRENREEYGAARKYYEQLLSDYPATPQAKRAGERLPVIKGYPAEPDKPLEFLKTVFPDQRQSSPLKLKSETISAADRQTVIR